MFTKLLEEIGQHAFFDFGTIVTLLGKFLPYFHKRGQISLEMRNDVVFWKIIMLKLLDNDQNEEVEHDMGAHKY